MEKTKQELLSDKIGQIKLHGRTLLKWWEGYSAASTCECETCNAIRVMSLAKRLDGKLVNSNNNKE